MTSQKMMMNTARMVSGKNLEELDDFYASKDAHSDAPAVSGRSPGRQHGKSAAGKGVPKRVDDNLQTQ